MEYEFLHLNTLIDEPSLAKMDVSMARNISGQLKTRNLALKFCVSGTENYQTLGKSTPRQIPEIFRSASVPIPNAKQSGRLELAQWIASADNPLTARVVANRLWRWLL